MTIGQDNLVPECHCLACGERFNAAASVGNDASPVEDDLTICVKCGHLMAFTKELLLRNLYPAEKDEAFSDPRVVAAQEAVRRVNSAH